MRTKLQKLLSTVLAMCMVLSIFSVPAFASDITGHWAQDTLMTWSQKGFLSGYGAGDYRPDNSVTRAEFVALVNRVQGYTNESGNAASYADVSMGDWYYPEFAKALAAGYIVGSNGSLNPNSAITRNEAVAIITRVAGLDATADYTAVLRNVSDSWSIPQWAMSSVGAAVNAGFITGYNGNFEGSRNITRAEAVVLLDRLYSGTRMYNFAGTYGGKNGDVLTANNVIVMAANVTLENVAVAKNLTIAKSVGDGEVYLDNVAVDGKLDIQGGGSNSVYLKNSKIAEVVVTKEAVHVVMQDGTSVTYVNVAGENPSIEIGNGVKIDKITIADDAAGAAIVVNSGATIQALEVKADGAAVSLGNGATVEAMTLSGANTEVALQNGAKVTTLTVAASSTDAVIQTSNGSSIGTVTLDAAAQVTGAGKITTANINAEGTSIASKPTTTNVAKDVTANVAGGNVSGGTSNTPSATPAPTSTPTSTPAPTSTPSSGGNTSTTPTVSENIATFKNQLSGSATNATRENAIVVYNPANDSVEVRVKAGTGVTGDGGALDSFLNEFNKYNTISSSTNAYFKVTQVAFGENVYTGALSKENLIREVLGSLETDGTVIRTATKTAVMTVVPVSGSAFNLNVSITITLEPAGTSAN